MVSSKTQSSLVASRLLVFFVPGGSRFNLMSRSQLSPRPGPKPGQGASPRVSSSVVKKIYADGSKTSIAFRLISIAKSIA